MKTPTPSLRELLALPDIEREVLKLIQSPFVMVGFYRRLTASTREMRNRRTGQKDQFTVVSHHVDAGEAQERRVIEEKIRWGASADDIVPPAQSGDLVACLLDSMQDYKGKTQYRGTIVRLWSPVLHGDQMRRADEVKEVSDE